MIQLTPQSRRFICVMAVKLIALSGYLVMITALMRWPAGHVMVAIQGMCAAAGMIAALTALWRRESAMAPGLNHWDEAMVFCLLAIAAAAIAAA